MATVCADIKLPEIERTITTHLYFPTDLPASVGNEVRGVITLLHGLSNTGADWMHMTAATRYAADNGYILIAPTADNSFYSDMRYGSPFFTALTELLPQKLHSMFQIPAAREQNFICGLSMGGYGALRIGLSYPERYAAVGSFSGVVDVAELVVTNPAFAGPILTPVFGEGLAIPEDADPFALAERVAALPAAAQPRVLCTCGTGDTLVGQNRRFRDAAALHEFRYLEWEGVHEWNFWDRSLAEFIGFVQGSDYAARKRADWAAPFDA